MSTSPRRRRLIIALTASLAACFGALAPASAQSIAVVVNGQPILTSEVQARLALLKLTGGKGSVAAAQQELIDDKLKLAETKRFGIVASDAQVDAAFASVAERVKLPPDQFAKAIAQRGVNPQTLKDRIRAEMSWAQLVRRKFAAQVASREAIPPAGGSVENKATQYTMRQVVFVVPKGASEAQAQQRRKEAIAARGRFPGCAGAVQFAASLRDVAVKEPVVRSTAQLGKEFNDVLSKVKVGGLTEPQRSEQGFEMIAVCERREISDDSVVRQQAMEEMGGKRVQEQAEKYLAQLKSKAIIEIRR
jgi:peptidyl-prolyl cis-trans isomerase SurA